MPALSGQRVLMTGATGFVGAELAKRLLAQGAEVFAIERPGGGDRWRVRDIEDAVAWLPAGLTDQAALSSATARARPHVVYHMATYYSVDNRVDLSAIVDVNIKAGLLLLDSCRGVDDLRLFVNVGTCAEFGDLRTPATEDSPLDPNSIYASTKAASVLAMRQYGSDEGVPLTTLRLYNMYGPFEKASRLAPDVTLSLIEGREVPLTGGEQAKDYTYLPDVVDAFVAAAERPEAAAGHTFNIGSGETVTMRELVEEIAGHFPDADRLLQWGVRPYRDNEMWYQGTSIARAGEVLGWRPRHSLAEGIAETVQWYRQNAGLYGRG